MTPMLALLRRELFERVRTLGHFATRFAAVAVLFLAVVLLSWETMVQDLGQPMSRAPELGQTLFRVFSFLQFGLVMLLVPLTGAGAIVEEREERSLQLLLLTHLNHWQIVAGKFLARLGAVGLIVISAVPILFLSAFLGGVEPKDVLHVFSLTMGVSSFFVGITLAASAVAKTATRAAMFSFSVLVLLLVSLFGLFWVDVSHYIWWHPCVALTIALAEPLNLGHAWWQSSLLMLGVGVLGVVASGVFLDRSFKRSHGASEEQLQAGGAVDPADLWSNPVAWREWARRGKTLRWMVLVVLLGGALSAILFFPDAYDVDEFATVGFNIIFFAASIYTLALGAGAFAQEKREQTLDLLRLTYMRPLSIFLGKMVAVWRLYLFTLALILPGLVVALLRSDRAPYAFGGGQELFMGALLLPPILFVVMSFFGAMGVFYSLVSSTPIRAAFPSVATYLYISTMMFMWPMLIFQSEKAVPLSIAIGWGLLFVPVLAFVARTNFWKALVLGGGVLLMLGLQLLLAVAIDEEAAMLGTHPFVFASATLLLHERDALGMLASGVSLYLSSTVLFAVAAVFLLQSQSLGEEQGEENEWVAALLSLLMPGAGQFYLGDHKRGAILLIGSLLLGCLAGLANIAAAIDAYKLARARQAQRRLQETMRRQRA